MFWTMVKRHALKATASTASAFHRTSCAIVLPRICSTTLRADLRAFADARSGTVRACDDADLRACRARGSQATACASTTRAAGSQRARFVRKWRSEDSEARLNHRASRAVHIGFTRKRPRRERHHAQDLRSRRRPDRRRHRSPRCGRRRDHRARRFRETRAHGERPRWSRSRKSPGSIWCCIRGRSTIARAPTGNISSAVTSSTSRLSEERQSAATSAACAAAPGSKADSGVEAHCLRAAESQAHRRRLHRRRLPVLPQFPQADRRLQPDRHRGRKYVFFPLSIPSGRRFEGGGGLVLRGPHVAATRAAMSNWPDPGNKNWRQPGRRRRRRSASSTGIVAATPTVLTADGLQVNRQRRSRDSCRRCSLNSIARKQACRGPSRTRRNRGVPRAGSCRTGEQPDGQSGPETGAGATHRLKCAPLPLRAGISSRIGSSTG